MICSAEDIYICDLNVHSLCTWIALCLRRCAQMKMCVFFIYNITLVFKESRTNSSLFCMFIFNSNNNHGTKSPQACETASRTSVSRASIRRTGHGRTTTNIWTSHATCKTANNYRSIIRRWAIWLPLFCYKYMHAIFFFFFSNLYIPFFNRDSALHVLLPPWLKRFLWNCFEVLRPFLVASERIL